MMNEIRERVKEAIAAKIAPAIDVRAPYAKVMIDEAARAAIAIMREPSEKMKSIIVPAGTEWPAREYWYAMIDAALMEE